MTKRTKKNEYSDLDKELDIEAFRDNILGFFSGVPDPRSQNNLTYKLEHIFFIILSAILAGANSINKIALFSKTKKKWITNFIPLEQTPSYGIFWWILVRIKPDLMSQLLEEWLENVPDKLKKQILAIDGKRLCGTQSDDPLKPFLHLVSLFAVDSGLILKQQRVDSKSNEITAIPVLFEGTNIEGAVITSDAMGCQKNIAAQICEKGADYVLALKGNVGLIYDEVRNYFEQAEQVNYDGVDCTTYEEKDTGHGRVVSRVVRCVQDLDWLPQAEEWKNLTGLVEVVSTRTEKGKISIERRYYITSLNSVAQRLAKIIRCHWCIENNLHPQLDVNFLEDDSSVNAGYAAENLAIFRRIALNILGSGKGLSDRRQRAAWDEEYLTNLIRNFLSNLSN